MTRLAVDGRLFGAVAISDDYGFPCVVARCRFRAVPTKDTVAALRVAREERDEHVRAMREGGDFAHVEWEPDRDEVRVAYEATFARPRSLMRKLVAGD